MSILKQISQNILSKICCTYRKDCK